MLKRFLAGLMAVICLAGLCACGQEAGTPPESTPAASSLPADPASSPPGGTEGQPDSILLDPLPVARGISPLTGLPNPEGVVDGLRPVAVTVGNNQRSLPQRGLSAADVLVEMVTEGGITRLLALYRNINFVPQVGPVRSTRDQFVQFAVPIGAIQAHIGTSIYARNLLTVLQLATVDGLYLGVSAFWFDEARSLPKLTGKLNEYCWFTDAALISAGMAANGIAAEGETRQLFLFGQPNNDAFQPGAGVVNALYSDVSDSAFIYDAATGIYTKTMLGSYHTDEDGSPLTFTNVLLLATDITMKPDGLCTEFGFTGGEGWYFAGGGVQPITWLKGGPEGALRLFGADGEELAVSPGKSYVGFVPNNGASVNWYMPEG